MKSVKGALAAAALTSIAVGAVASLEGSRRDRAAGSLNEPAPAIVHAVSATATLPPVIVMARRPTVSEILDIILRERPSALELAGHEPSKSFPDGSDEARIAGMLRRYTPEPDRADRIAGALVREGRRRKVGSTLLVGVMLTENPWLDPRATSFVGARGLMQVMPFHAGKWGCPSGDLFDIDANICHGVAILADNLSRSKTLSQALLAYNGCVRGTNTPDCRRYPAKVYREARKSDDRRGAFEVIEKRRAGGGT